VVSIRLRLRGLIIAGLVYPQSMLALGMAVVSMDVRGSGASFGSHPAPWRELEVQDGMEVLEWVSGEGRR
jgi:predicted acyl esterase